MNGKIDRLLDALTHSGPGYEVIVPRRDDRTAGWLKRHRDRFRKDTESWLVLDGLLDEYRLHADTMTPLDVHACVHRCECGES